MLEIGLVTFLGVLFGTVAGITIWAGDNDYDENKDEEKSETKEELRGE